MPPTGDEPSARLGGGRAHGRGRMPDVRRGEPLRAGVLARKRGIRRAGWALGVRRKVLGVPPRRGKGQTRRSRTPGAGFPSPGRKFGMAPTNSPAKQTRKSRVSFQDLQVSQQQRGQRPLHAREPRDDRGERVRHAHVAHLAGHGEDKARRMAVHAQGGVRPVVARALAPHVHLRSAPTGHHRADARRAEAAHRHQVPGETPHRSGRQPHELEAGDRARRDQRRGGARAELRAREGGGVRPHPRAGQLGDDRSALRIIRGKDGSLVPRRR
mmetsp:Transcript_3953/g.17455  ORF Transcript_3953/g.17455 Transcript_3953/m.17455 type:complete len:270 (-) Transcript_3953:2278-3087(-)